MHENEISERVIGAAIEVHKILGPGLIESIYEEAFCREFALRNIEFKRQQAVPIGYKGVNLASDLRLDLIVFDKVIVDLKAKERMTEIDHAKTLSYLRLTGKRLGLNINFHETLLIHGIERIANDLVE